MARIQAPPQEPQTLTERLERELMRRRAREHYRDFVVYQHPEWEFPEAHEVLMDVLDKFVKGTLIHPESGKVCYNLVVNMPPRHSKSEHCTILLPIFYMGRDPRNHVMTNAYGDDLARDFARSVRRLRMSPRTREVFPELVVPAGSDGTQAWKTTENGSYFSVSLGGTTSGRPATMAIMDDPIKNRPAANSRAKRDEIWQFYNSALVKRLQPHANGMPPLRLVIHTRWSPDDPTGRIMKTQAYRNGEWYHLNMSAIISDERKEALWPARFPYELLAQMRRDDPFEFACQHQQQPYVQGGQIIKRDHFQYYNKELMPDDWSAVLMVMDTAMKTSTQHDYTVIQVWGLARDYNCFLLDQHRGKMEYPQLKAKVQAMGFAWRPKGLRGIYIEDKQSGSNLLSDLRQGSGLPVLPWIGHMDKVGRVMLSTPMLEAGRVYLPDDAPWIREFLEECELFPNGKFDDQVDTFAMAMDVMSRLSVPADAMAGVGSMDLPSLLQEYNTEKRHLAASPVSAHHDRSLDTIVRGRGGFTWKGWGY